MMSLTKRILFFLPLSLGAFLIVYAAALSATEDIPPAVVYLALDDLDVDLEQISSPQRPIFDTKTTMMQVEEPSIDPVLTEPFPLEPFAPTGHFEMRLFGNSPKVAVGPDDMLIGYYPNGILSTNKGISWQLLELEYPTEQTNHINMPPTSNEPIFIGVGSSTLSRSFDEGQSWETVLGGGFLQSTYSPTYQRDSLVFALRQSPPQLARSVDKGSNWAINDVPRMQNIALAPDFADRPIMIGSSPNAAYYSADGGYSWELANYGLDMEHGNRVREVLFSPNHTSDNVALALTDYGIYRSVLSGNGWGRWLPFSVKKFIPHPQFPHVPTFFVIATVRIEERLVDVLLRTDDYGRNYQGLVAGVTDFDLSHTYGIDNADLYAMVPEGLIYSNDNGATWYIMSQSIGQENGILSDLKTSPNIATDQTIYILNGRQLLRTTNLGYTWQNLPLPIDQGEVHLAISPHFGTDNMLFLLALTHGGDQQQIFRSNDRGQSWELINSQLPFYDATSFQLSPNYTQDQTIFVSSYFQFVAPYANGLFRSQDGGQTWHNLYPNQPLRDFAISPQYPLDSRMFVAIQNKGIARSDNGGATWAQLDTPHNNVQIKLSPNFHQDNTIILKNGNDSGGGAWRSIDAGDSWQAIYTQEMSNFNDTLSLSSQFGQDQTALLGVRDRGIFMTEDGGDSWFLLQTGFSYQQSAIPYWQGRPHPIIAHGLGFFIYVWPSETRASFNCQSLTLENEETQTARITFGTSTTQPFGWHIRPHSVPWLTAVSPSQMAPEHPSAQVQINTAEITTSTSAKLTVDVYLSYRQKQTHTISAFVPCFGQNLPVIRKK